ncbi:MAG: hypothetical protein LBP59_04710 [Planctomycetaceae bacterium]|jgi:hypothetical protein|nr:hypothetical protein [Planctomycetaceae bacterium]
MSESQINVTKITNDISSKTAMILFWSVVGFFAALWVILPAIFHTGYRNIDVIELQGIAKEWVWATDEDVNRKGGMIVWNISEISEADNYVPDWVYKRFPKAKTIPEPIILSYKTRAKVPPLKIGVAIVPPENFEINR